MDRAFPKLGRLPTRDWLLGSRTWHRLARAGSADKMRHSNDSNGLVVWSWSARLGKLGWTESQLLQKLGMSAGARVCCVEL